MNDCPLPNALDKLVVDAHYRLNRMQKMAANALPGKRELLVTRKRIKRE
jgi:hypothetical protein